jgi:hypothetical protein
LNSDPWFEVLKHFGPRHAGCEWNPKKPYHVALEDIYVREHWSGIDAICKLNSLPFILTGEKIQRDGTWCVFEFTWQMDAILFWHRFQTYHCIPMTSGGRSADLQISRRRAMPLEFGYSRK